MKHKFIGRAAAAALVLGLGASTFSAGAANAAEAKPAHDLSVNYTVSSAKAKGYAGLVAIHAKNEGSQRYYSDFPAISFRIDVKTDKGPEGVDRVITPGWFNGAYTQDLGFDEKTSTRSFMVTLSNPVNVGENQLIANLNFGDGLTKEGRLNNYIQVTQVGRLDDDTTTDNDQNVDSRQHTLSDFGKPIDGVF
ncbi:MULTISPECIES: hypothetical protein [Micrococcales]|uniref:hypothetical protein n=1 Tax=Micrococcales TaxID=85006 RepID=UPI0004ABA636|nr:MULTISPECIES: hypothetical protein [Micrococcales]